MGISEYKSHISPIKRSSVYLEQKLVFSMVLNTHFQLIPFFTAQVVNIYKLQVASCIRTTKHPHRVSSIQVLKIIITCTYVKALVSDKYLVTASTHRIP